MKIKEILTYFVEGLTAWAIIGTAHIIAALILG